VISLLILSAGESTRMGSPKALLKIGKETFAECIARKANEAGIDSIYLITGADHESIVQHLSQDFQIIRNENYQRGQISSLQAGIRQVPDHTQAVMVWPVDQPLIQEETVRILLATYQRTSRVLTIPVYQLHRGHPVIYSKQAMKTAISLGPEQTGKDLQSLFLTQTHVVEVDDPAILIDIDTPEDYSEHIMQRRL
jgi:molybdenum cofactor cytidylyltransferase